MAVPLKQPETKEQRSAASAFAQWTRKWGAALGGPIVAVLFAFTGVPSFSSSRISILVGSSL